MKQLLQNLKTGDTVVAEVPSPTSRPRMALVKTEASLVSAGTERMLVEFAERNLVGKAQARPDLVRQVLDKARREGLVPTIKSALNRLDQPLTLGYSSAGSIVELGTDLSGFSVGQRVACAGAGFAIHAEYTLVPGNLLAALPDQVDFESAAFATLGAIGLHGFRLSEARIGEYVAIIGLGLLGNLTAQIAEAAGCLVFGIDVDPRRVHLAESLALRASLRDNVEESAQAFTKNRGFDVVLICADTSANDPIELAGDLARDRARIVAIGAVGLNMPRKVYYEKELSFINSRSYGPGRYDQNYELKGQDYPPGYVRWTEGRNLEAVVNLLAADKLKVKPLITHRIPIQGGQAAYDLITGKKNEPYLGILLTYGEARIVSEKKVELRAGGGQRGATVGQRTSKRGKDNKVKLGVIGAGNFANAVLLPAIEKVGSIELTAIVSTGGVHAQHTGRKFGFGYTASSEKELLADPNINTIAILTRHDSHSDLAIEALKAGKHVFIEKPLAINDDQLSEIRGWLEGDKCPLLTVGFNRRFAPLAKSLLTFLGDRKEPLHAHYRVNAGYLGSDHWTQDPDTGGGRVIGEGCHFIDFLTFLVGSPPVKVSAQALPNLGKYHEDNVSMTFIFPDGSVGILDYLANGDKAYSKERLEVFCGGKIASLEDFSSLEIVQQGKRRVEKKAQDKGWQGEWRAFADAITTQGNPPIPYNHLIGVTKATFAALDSLRRNHQVDIG